LPVYLWEASRLFGQKVDDDIESDEMADVYDFVRSKVSSMKMELFYTEGRYILGYQLNMASDEWQSVDDVMNQLSTLKADFKREMSPYYQNFDAVEIYSPDERNRRIVHLPDPYVIWPKSPKRPELIVANNRLV
jgi:hypothetical protein